MNKKEEMKTIERIERNKCMIYILRAKSLQSTNLIIRYMNFDATTRKEYVMLSFEK